MKTSKQWINLKVYECENKQGTITSPTTSRTSHAPVINTNTHDGGRETIKEYS